MTATSRGPRRLVLFVGALVATFLITRGGMVIRPNADVFVAGYNIHHVFTGILIATICTVPLIVGAPRPVVGDVLVAGVGVGLSLALDEVVYLIVTDGSNQSYLSRASWIGGIVLIGLTCAYAIVVAYLARRIKD